MAGGELSMDNPIFRMYIGYAALVIVKTLLMAPITAYYRITNKVFANPEDTAAFGGPKKLSVVTDHPAVERVRRCHLNDIENVIAFVLMGLLYVSTDPSLYAAAMHFRVFTASRFIHTFVYLAGIPQPSRAAAFFTGMGCTFSMAYSVFAKAAF